MKQWLCVVTSGSTNKRLFNASKTLVYEITLFVAVAVGATTTLTSAAPATEPRTWLDSWFVRSSGTTNDLAMVNFGDKQFVAVGFQGTILTSSNGVTWIRRPSPTVSDIYSIAYGAGQWVAVGPSGLVMTSSNAVSWTVRDALLLPSLYNVVYGNSRFVAVGSVPNAPFSEIVTSINGITWTSATVNGVVLSGITYGNNRFVTVGGHAECLFSCDIYPDIYTSTNGLPPWANQFPPGLDFSLVDVAYGTNIFVTVGSDGALLTSGAGSGWTKRTIPVTADLNSVGFGSGHFISAGASGIILSSTNATNWTRCNSPVSNQLYEVTFGNGTFVIVGQSGTILQSQAPPVSLRIAATGSGMATISWTPTELSGFALQYAEPLAPTNWVDAPSGTENPVTVPMSGSRLYRLIKP